MRVNPRRIRWLIILAALLVLHGIYWRFVSLRSHGRIYESRAVDDPKKLIGTVGEILHGKESLKSTPWREVLSSDNNYLDVGPAKMEWSAGGYLYFNMGVGPWEFAPTSKRDLKKLSKEDLQCEFFGEKDANGPKVFRGQWFTSGIQVSTGQIVLARLAKKPRIVYALKIRRQDSDAVRVSVLEF